MPTWYISFLYLSGINFTMCGLMLYQSSTGDVLFLAVHSELLHDGAFGDDTPFPQLKFGRTSFCVVSLVARTARGRAAIKAAGWESARDPNTSIFLPQDPTVLFQVRPHCLTPICVTIYIDETWNSTQGTQARRMFYLVGGGGHDVMADWDITVWVANPACGQLNRACYIPPFAPDNSFSRDGIVGVK